MPYIFHRLAAGSYDLLLDGEIVARVVRDVTDDRHVQNWQAELLNDTPPLPAPFTKSAHCIETLEEAVNWLGDATITAGG